jgi:hypothetical protein
MNDGDSGEDGPAGAGSGAGAAAAMGEEEEEEGRPAAGVVNGGPAVKGEDEGEGGGWQVDTQREWEAAVRTSRLYRQGARTSHTVYCERCL